MPANRENVKPQGPVCSRWIAVCVDVFEHPVFEGQVYSKRDAWLWLIKSAAWKDKRINHKGRPVDLKRGQVLAGRTFLAETWGWGEKQVRLFLEILASENMIEKGQSNGHYANVVTITNYDIYQRGSEAEKPELGPEQGQSTASAGPVQGQTLTSNTNTTCESEDAGAQNLKPDEVNAGHGVIVNCETIRHPSFTISLPGIRMNTIASGQTADQIKTACLGHALQWAAEIEGGKPAAKVVPDKIANFLSASIMGSKVRSDVADVRKSKAAEPYQPSGTAPEAKAKPTTKEILAAMQAEGFQQ